MSRCRGAESGVLPRFLAGAAGSVNGTASTGTGQPGGGAGGGEGEMRSGWKCACGTAE